MRSAGSYGGFYAAMSRHYDQKYDSEAYRIQEARLFAQSRAGQFSRLCHQTWEGMGGNGKGIIDDVVCVVLDGTSMLLAGMKLIIQQAHEMDQRERKPEEMTDQELYEALR